MKKIVLVFLYAIVSIYFIGCENDYSTLINLDNGKYTTVPTVSTTTYKNVTITEITYIVNINTGKFHYPDCSSVKQMNDENKHEYSCNRDDLVSKGYKSCKKCNP